jgi:hypothetical protein
MAVATVVIRPGLPGDSFVSGKYTCAGSLTATPINIGFVPSAVEVWNITDGDTFTFWSQDMADATAMTITTAVAAVATNGITPIAQTDGTNHGFQVGTDVSVQEASKVFGFRAYR